MTEPITPPLSLVGKCFADLLNERCDVEVNDLYRQLARLDLCQIEDSIDE